MGAPDKRSRLVDAAVELAYRQGFHKTSIADLASEAQVPVGNVYYYYKTKEQIGEAVLDRRLAEFAQLRELADTLPSPKDRLLLFIRLTLDNRSVVAERGCPMGSLCAELLKGGGELAQKSNVLFAEPMAWMEKQFAELGKVEEAANLALQLQASLQGVSLLAQSYRNPALIEIEARRLSQWLDEI